MIHTDNNNYLELPPVQRKFSYFEGVIDLRDAQERRLKSGAAFVRFALSGGGAGRRSDNCARIGFQHSPGRLRGRTGTNDGSVEARAAA